MSDYLYIFLDEGGNFDFSPRGTQYFTLTGVVKQRPFLIGNALDALKYDLLEQGKNIEYFHASEDMQVIRNQVFNAITGNMGKTIIDSLIVEKRKTHPSLYDEGKFYPMMLGYLIRYILERVNFSQISEVVVITDTIPIKKKAKAIEKAVKEALSDMLPAGYPYRILHHASKSSYGLQVADYCNWAIYRKWNTGHSDLRSYNLIQPVIRSEFDIFRRGAKYFY